MRKDDQTHSIPKSIVDLVKGPEGSYVTFIPMLSRNPFPRFTINNGDTTIIGVESIGIRRRDELTMLFA